MNLYYKLLEGQGIGNQLYSIFSLSTLASLVGRRPILVNYDKYKGRDFLPLSSSHFGLIPSDGLCVDREFIRDCPRYHPLSGLDVTNHVDFVYNLLVQKHSHIEIAGNLQNLSFIPESLNLLNLFECSIPDVVLKYSAIKEHSCVLHVRGGDYKKTLANMPQKYYSSAVAYLRELSCHDLSVDVVSDDLEHASKIAGDIGEIRLGERSPADAATASHHTGVGIDRDFFALASARYAVIPASTFSLTSRIIAHLLNPNAITIAPYGWYGFRLGVHYAAPYSWAYPHFRFIDSSGRAYMYEDCPPPSNPLFVLHSDIHPVVRTLLNRATNFFIK